MQGAYTAPVSYNNQGMLLGIPRAWVEVERDAKYPDSLVGQLFGKPIALTPGRQLNGIARQSVHIWLEVVNC